MICAHSVPFVFILSILQHVFLTSFLFYQDRKEKAAAILKKLYPPHEVEAEVEALRLSVEAEIVEEGSIGVGNIFTKIKNAWSNTVVRRGLATGTGCQVAQQFVGINTVMYYSSTIVQLAGYASNSVALALSLITSGLNAFAVSGVNTAAFRNSTCVDYTNAPNAANWDCMLCLAAADDCGFCANSGDHIYPLRHKGICGGMAAVANWVSNLIASQTFLSLTGSGYTFMLFGFISSGALVYLYMFVPETQGLAFEEVEKKLGRTSKAWENHSDDENSTSGKAAP
ncbi:hypothetical protein GIB67_004521 [Kingdonia uniflora]|uniref:Major facilitator superfamily (MFS) profile domain-containing protein n=1 Tax=Kingdonia uniflora TaxID=39325 RepID=A0A7J7NJY9_9MAGN|nr:hypothetical protein GIB67_004521 [Kingdonia uniflora]